MPPAHRYCTYIPKGHVHHSQAGTPSGACYLHVLCPCQPHHDRLLPLVSEHQCASSKGPRKPEKHLMCWRGGISKARFFLQATRAEWWLCTCLSSEHRLKAAAGPTEVWVRQDRGIGGFYSFLSAEHCQVKLNTENGSRSSFFFFFLNASFSILTSLYLKLIFH